MWTWFKAFLIRSLGGFAELSKAEEKIVVEEKTLFFRHPEPTLIPLDRPFDSIDWERLSTLPNREPLLFEWAAHCVNNIDTAADKLGAAPEFDRERFGLQRDRRAYMRLLRISTEASDHLVKLLRSKELHERKLKGMNNHGQSQED